MSSPGIANSDAVLLENKILPQHQAALTLLSQKLSHPEAATVSWLDLGCGKGQIVSQLDENIAADLRSKIIYHGYDLKVEHVKITEHRVKQLALQEATFKVGDLPDFARNFADRGPFDFVTITNTIHEIAPRDVGAVFFDAIERLNEHGVLFAYDMEQLQEEELGAVPWKRSDIAAMMQTLLTHIGVDNYAVPVNRWTHSTVKGWSLTVDKEHILRVCPGTSSWIA
jgi:cyclopropane fatty-acyl-phospholipid synthase-like methyltransferase